MQFIKDNFLFAIMAFFIWGGWAFYVNNLAAGGGLLAGLVQGSASFAITVFMLVMVRFWYSRFKSRLVSLVMAPLLSVSLTSIGLLLLHITARTPNIASTILPAILVALVFAVYMTYKLDKKTDG